MPSLIVTGNSTDVGKTVVSAILARAFHAEYWKPIEAGGDDSGSVHSLSGVYCHPPAYRLQHPLSPHHAARLEGVNIDPKKIVPPPAKRLIIEGSGGLLVPYGDDHLGSLFTGWQLPWVVVSRHYLGSINHTLLTLEWLKNQRQRLLGIIFNGEPNRDSEEAILNFSGVPCLGRLPFTKPLNRRNIQCYAQQFSETLRQSGIPLHSEEPILIRSPL